MYKKIYHIHGLKTQFCKETSIWYSKVTSELVKTQTQILMCCKAKSSKCLW